MTALTTTPNYDRMRQAIAECHSFDEVTEIRDKAVAMEAYYKQIRDEDAYWKFREIRLRAIRRYGELIISFVGPFNPRKRNWNTVYKELCAAMPDTAVKPRNYQAIMQPCEVALIPADIYEERFPDLVRNLSGTLGLMARAAGHYEDNEKPIYTLTKRDVHQWEKRRSEEELEEKYELQDEDRFQDEAIKAQEEAVEEVSKEIGYTLTRHDRKDMKQVVFIIKRPIHEEMRQAAFDNRCTMQEILRQGLDMWLNAHHRKPTETET